MKRILLTWIMVFSFLILNAQKEEAEQLLLNVEKLKQFRKILKNMKDGYTVLYKGYTNIRDISNGNFSMHKDFLDALMEVSPVVKKYKRIVDIINYQLRIVKEYKSAFRQFKESKNFTIEEIEYMAKVYGNLINESLKALNELSMVVTAGELRMTDDERLNAIDRIYNKIVDQFSFLKDFNNNTALLSLQRTSEQTEIEMSKKLIGQ